MFGQLRPSFDQIGEGVIKSSPRMAAARPSSARSIWVASSRSNVRIAVSIWTRTLVPRACGPMRSSDTSRPFVAPFAQSRKRAGFDNGHWNPKALRFSRFEWSGRAEHPEPAQRDDRSGDARQRLARTQHGETKAEALQDQARQHEARKK